MTRQRQGADSAFQRVISRLSGYWKMEAGCAVALPFAGLYVLRDMGAPAGPWVILSMAAASVLLLIGAACWRMELAVATGDRALARRIRRWLAPTRGPAQALAALGLLAALMQLWADRRWTPQAIAATAFGVLAVLEYLNYYVVQLQHFDHLADFRRLIAGKGFRRPHLAKAIARYRAGDGRPAP